MLHTQLTAATTFYRVERKKKKKSTHNKEWEKKRKAGWMAAAFFSSPTFLCAPFPDSVGRKNGIALVSPALAFPGFYFSLFLPEIGPDFYFGLAAAAAVEAPAAFDPSSPLSQFHLHPLNHARQF